MTRLFTPHERELIEDALKASAFKYRHAFVNAACRTTDRRALNTDDEGVSLAELTRTETMFVDKANAFDNLASIFRRNEVRFYSTVEIPEQ